MTYSIITPADNADFFAQFKTFVVSAGWTIDAQSDTELYIHSGTTYLSFRMGDIYCTRANALSWTSQESLSTIFFTCAINTGYDSTKDFFNQPGSSINNINVSSAYSFNTVTYPKTMHALYCNNITEAVFVADGNNIIIRVRRGALILNSLIITKMTKAYSFSGGLIVSSSEVLHSTAATAGSASTNKWLFPNYCRWQGQVYPFEFGARTSLSNNSYIVQSQFCTSFLINGEWVLSNANPSTIMFLTNIISNIASTTIQAKATYLLDTILGLGASMYSGLSTLISPQFFYTNGAGSYFYCGAIEKLYLTAKTNLVDKQTLNYGAKEYLILNLLRSTDQSGYITIDSTHFLAVEL